MRPGLVDSYDPVSGQWNDSLIGDFVWTNVNVGEAVPEVMTPLAWSILRDSFADTSIIPGYNVIGNICGRPYNNVSLIFWMLRLARRSVVDYGNELGIAYFPHRELIERSSFHLPPKDIFPIIRRLTRVALSQRRALSGSIGFLSGNPAWCAAAKTRLAGIQDPISLFHFWADELALYGLSAFWMVYTSAMEYTGLVGRLRRQLVELVGPSDASLLLSCVSAESELLASLGPVVGAWKVFRGQWTTQEFYRRYGHRGPGEGDFLSPHWKLDTRWLERELEALAENPVDVDAMLADQRRLFDEALKRLQRRLPRKAGSLRLRLDRAASLARLREAVRSEFIRLSSVTRLCVVQAGRLIRFDEDVFFLTHLEIWDLLRGLASDAPAQIPPRKAAYQLYRSLPPYPGLICGHFDAQKWAADPDRQRDVFDSHQDSVHPSSITLTSTITGMAGSAGIVEGLVRRIDSLDDGNLLLPGEILVTSQTNVQWTPLFPRLAAVITDIGAPLSHAAIVARELGIPAVVGCSDATLRLKTGDRVLVDGSLGIVKILS